MNIGFTCVTTCVNMACGYILLFWKILMFIYIVTYHFSIELKLSHQFLFNGSTTDHRDLPTE